MSSEMPRPPWLVVTLVPWVLLAALTAYTVITKLSAGESLAVDLGLCLATAAWMLAMFTLRPGWWHRARPMTVFFAGLVLLTAILVLRDPMFGLFTTVPYIYAYAILPWPGRLPAVAVVAVVAATAQASSVDKAGARGLAIYAGIIVFNIVIMVGMAWVLHLDERERIDLSRALADLSRANQLLEASAAENASLHSRLLTQAKETGVLEERRRMAREIHDTVAQGLAGIVAQLRAAEQIRPIPEPWRRHVEAANGLARQSLTEARRSVDALRPEPLETTHLGEALAEVAERWSALQGLPVRVTTTGTPRPMQPEAELALFRTAQEALANVARHAHATRVALTLSYLDHEVALDVLDDGRGFDPAELPAAGVPEAPSGAEAASGFGLMIMRQRLEALAGTLRIESEPGAGTGISARVPLPPTEDHR
jgi:signal transduction histidine kinase